LQVSEGEFARSEYGRFAATKAQRIADLQQALDDSTVKAILCSRGGYGLVQIVDDLDFTAFAENPKWLIGFSDITILHNVISGFGIASLHAIMAKHLTELQETSEQVQTLKSILFGQLPDYEIGSTIYNRVGVAKGKLIGGNLSVFVGLNGTKFDLVYDNNILFIEDIAERPYHIDRMLHSLKLSGALSRISGLVVGQFSDCDEDPLMKQTIVEIIIDAVKDYSYPVCFNFPSGHVDFNLPLVLGQNVDFTVDINSVKLKF
jgi:muramoyltetrapeptide carboxypeptidase